MINLFDLTNILMCGGAPPRAAAPAPIPVPAPKKQPKKTAALKQGAVAGASQAKGIGGGFGGTLLTGTQGIGDTDQGKTIIGA